MKFSRLINAWEWIRLKNICWNRIWIRIASVRVAEAARLNRWKKIMRRKRKKQNGTLNYSNLTFVYKLFIQKQGQKCFPLSRFDWSNIEKNNGWSWCDIWFFSVTNTRQQRIGYRESTSCWFWQWFLGNWG